MSARRVTTRVQAMSQRFSGSAASGRFRLDQKSLQALVVLLSHTLQAAITGPDLKEGTFSRVDEEGGGGGDGNGSFAPCDFEGAASAQQVVRLVSEVLEMPTDLMLVRGNQASSSTDLCSSDYHRPVNFQTYVLFHGVREHRVDSELIVVHAAHRTRTPAVVSGDSAAVYLPDSLFLLPLAGHRGEPRSGPGRPCVLAVLTELTRSPFAWARHHERVRRPRRRGGEPHRVASVRRCSRCSVFLKSS